jgi:hypothetical protein
MFWWLWRCMFCPISVPSRTFVAANKQIVPMPFEVIDYGFAAPFLRKAGLRGVEKLADVKCSFFDSWGIDRDRESLAAPHAPLDLLMRIPAVRQS